ncbi:hypothetical protein ACT3SZ_16360 [Corynebacterium sp. AOP40-9SA-29]|uniref:hypothetical protein n=1 Tax=Corynebacterium sp. AOP40-9SA-29 TaxID=3457677 RepID=UPI0040338BF2
MSGTISGLLGILAGAACVWGFYLLTEWREQRARKRHRLRPEPSAGPHVAGTIGGVETPTEDPFVTGVYLPSIPDPRPQPWYRIRYRPGIGAWAIYEWKPEWVYNPSAYAGGPLPGEWVMKTLLPTGHAAISLINQSPATERD